MKRQGLLAALAASDGIILLSCRPHFAQLSERLRHPQQWIAQAGPDRAAADLASAALWLTALWLTIGLAAAMLGHLPGAIGASSRLLARLVLPRGLCRLAAGAIGIGVVLAPAAAATAAQGTARPTSIATSHSGVSLAAPVPIPSPSLPRAVDTMPAPQLPRTPTTVPTPTLPKNIPVPAPASQHPTLAPAPDARPPARTVPAPANTAPARPAAPSQLIVHPGDTLWSMTATLLPKGTNAARIAATWPRLYQANRDQIGDNPHFLVPGQVLNTAGLNSAKPNPAVPHSQTPISSVTPATDRPITP